MDTQELRAEIEKQRDLMIAVSTGGPRIQSVDGLYRERRDRIQDELASMGIENPNPYDTLWDWYGRWSSGDLPTWQSRRQYISGLFGPLIDLLRRGQRPHGQRVVVEPTGWAKVDRQLHRARSELATSTTEEEYQAVGHYCREAFISLAQSVYDPEKHATLNGTAASKTDAKRMLEAYVASELEGSSNEALRRQARAAISLASDLLHKRTADVKTAALCVEATTSIVHTIGIIAGRITAGRGREEHTGTDGLTASEDRAVFARVRRQMPELIAEMKGDLEEKSVVRDFFVLPEKALLTSGESHFRYHDDVHEDLHGKIAILENRGYVRDITPGNTPKYRMTEEFVELVLSSRDGQSGEPESNTC